jgi:hypothetical protein
MSKGEWVTIEPDPEPEPVELTVHKFGRGDVTVENVESDTGETSAEPLPE